YRIRQRRPRAWVRSAGSSPRGQRGEAHSRPKRPGKGARVDLIEAAIWRAIQFSSHRSRLATVAAGRSFDAFSACLVLLVNTRIDARRFLLSPLDIHLANEAAVFLVLFAKVSTEIRAARSNWKEP